MLDNVGALSFGIIVALLLVPVEVDVKGGERKSSDIAEAATSRVVWNRGTTLSRRTSRVESTLGSGSPVVGMSRKSASMVSTIDSISSDIRDIAVIQ